MLWWSHSYRFAQNSPKIWVSFAKFLESLKIRLIFEQFPTEMKRYYKFKAIETILYGIIGNLSTSFSLFIPFFKEIRLLYFLKYNFSFQTFTIDSKVGTPYSQKSNAIFHLLTLIENAKRIKKTFSKRVFRILKFSHYERSRQTNRTAKALWNHQRIWSQSPLFKSPWNPGGRIKRPKGRFTGHCNYNFDITKHFLDSSFKLLN